LIIQAIFPNASKLYQADQPKFFSFLKKVYFGTLAIGALISIVTYLAAPWIIKVLSRGELDGAVGYLQLLAAIPFLACLNVGNVMILLVTNLKDLLFRASWMFCGYMICVSTALTHFYGGAGLCIAILSTELMVFFICLYLLYRHKKELLYGFYS
jgi:PST family polysaccharide transporter